MKRARLVSAVLAVLAFAGFASQSQTRSKPTDLSKIRTPLLTSWQFREAGKDTWYPASVPGCVHTDLLGNKLIDDPFYRDNEKKLQWIGKTDWEYQTTFNITAEMLARDSVELIFEGLDTYANVFLNDEPLISTDNMFRTWRVDAKRLAKRGANTLRVRFRSPINEVLPLRVKMDYELPAGNDQGEKTSPHTRKAPYQYGWDWGPRFVTSGIWRSVSLEVWDHARIDNVRIVTTRIIGEDANVTGEVEIVSTGNATATVILENVSDKIVASRRSAVLTPGVN